VNGREPPLGVADVPSTPFVEAGAVEAAGDVEEAGAVAAATFFGLDECCAPCTPLVAGVWRETLLLFVLELFVVELFVTELLVVELLVVELFTTELFVVLLLVTLVEVVTVVVLVDEPH
jgi:hypothetical protein